jgi:CelD/BcsL family acetyltransferase involved in cellulose biosynthesis
MRPTSTALKPRDYPAAPPVEPDPTPAPYEFEVVRTRAGFDALASEWNDLFARAGHSSQMFQQFAWNWHWCNHYLSSDGSALAVLTVHRGGRLVMVWPLVNERVMGLTRLTWMGSPVSQYGDVLIDHVDDPLALLRAGWDHVLAAVEPDVIELPRLRADGVIAPLLDDLGAQQIRHQQAPYLDLKSAPDFDTYMRRHSSKSRKKRRALSRKLAEQGAQFTSYAESAKARETVASAIAMKRDQLIERGIISPSLVDPRMQKFFADVASGNALPAGLIAYALEFDGDQAAIDVLLACKGRIATHVFAYQEKYAKDRVGAYILERTIEQSFADGRDTFDLLAPADAYKMRWADGTVDVIDWAYPVSARGRVYTRVYLQTVRPALKALANAMPASIGQRLAAAYARRRSVS